MHPNPAIQDNRCHAVLADGVMRAGALAWDEDEEMEVVTAPVDDVLACGAGAVSPLHIGEGCLHRRTKRLEGADTAFVALLL